MATRMLEPTPGAVPTQTEKTPSTRLLDMTAGWAAFVDGEEDDITDHAVSVDELAGLYQAAGQLACDYGDSPDEAERVREFVETRVLPLLLREA